MWKRTIVILLAALVAVPLVSTTTFARSKNDRGREKRQKKQKKTDRNRQKAQQEVRREDRRKPRDDRYDQRDRVAHLIDRLRSGQTWQRRNAATELGSMAAHAAIPALSHALLHDRDETVRRNAAHAFLRIGSRRALPALRRAARTDRSRRVRRECQISIRDILENPRYAPGRRPGRYTPPRRSGHARREWKPSRQTGIAGSNFRIRW